MSESRSIIDDAYQLLEDLQSDVLAQCSQRCELCEKQIELDLDMEDRIIAMKDRIRMLWVKKEAS